MDSQQPTGHAQQNSQSTNCKSSVCMFFGSAATEGYCSVCYKKELKKREKANNNNNNISSSSNPTETSTQQQPTASTPSTTNTPSTTATTTATSSAIMQSSISSSNNTTQPQQQQTVTSHQQNSSPNPPINQSDPIAISSPPASKRRNADSLCVLSPGTPESGGASVPLSNSSPSKPKKRKCGVCKKKVGLTGFTCRCGGLFCPLHRYGDKHNCTYDYKTEERNKLSKDNPVVQDEKIAKI